MVLLLSGHLLSCKASSWWKKSAPPKEVRIRKPLLKEYNQSKSTMASLIRRCHRANPQTLHWKKNQAQKEIVANILLERSTATICSHSGSAAARFWLFWTTLAIPSGALARFGNISKVSPRSAPLRIDASKVFLMNAASNHWEQMSGRKSKARRAKLSRSYFHCNKRMFLS